MAGDIDGNGAVDFADFLTLSANFGSEGVNRSEGDLNGDHRVNFADFLILSGNFGFRSEMPVPAPSQSHGGVHERLFSRPEDVRALSEAWNDVLDEDFDLSRDLDQLA